MEPEARKVSGSGVHGFLAQQVDHRVPEDQYRGTGLKLLFRVDHADKSGSGLAPEEPAVERRQQRQAGHATEIDHQAAGVTSVSGGSTQAQALCGTPKLTSLCPPIALLEMMMNTSKHIPQST